MLNDLHLIRNSKVLTAFHIPTNTILRLSPILFKVLTKYVSGSPLSTISEEMNIRENRIQKLINRINAVVSKKPIVVSRNQDGYLDRITLHVSNDCNLSCTYCYSGGGNYSEPKGLLSMEKAKQIIDFFFSNYEKVGMVCFFGGEPLINWKVIQYVCEYIEKLYNSKIIRYLPGYVIITNGTILNSEIVSLIKKFKINLTVSIDGPKDINDHHRMFNNDKGSYDKIHHFIKTIQKNSKTHISFEATYTEKHQEMGYSEDDIYFFLRKEFGIEGVVVPVYMSSNIARKYAQNIVHNNNNDHIFKRIDKIFNKELKDDVVWDPIVIDLLYRLANGIPKEMCPIGDRMLATTVDGEIYPCHMNVGKKHLSLGNIKSENIITHKERFKRENTYLSLVKKEVEKCKTCWMKNLCGGCSVRNFFDNNTSQYMEEPPEYVCKMQEKFIEKIICQVAYIQSDKDSWSTFIKRINKLKHKNDIIDCV